MVCSGGISAFLTTPLDVVKTRIMLKENVKVPTSPTPSTSSSYSSKENGKKLNYNYSLYATFKDILHKEGWLVCWFV